MKIVVLDGYGLNPGDLSWDSLRQYGELTVYDRTLTEEETISRINDAEIIVLNKTPITRSVLEACPSIRLICVLATGYNIVDCDAAAERGIPVCNVPGYATQSVAQFTFALILELCHRIGHHSHAVHSGKWSNCPDFCFWDMPQMELNGKTIGIIGYGSIGQAVAKIAKAFGLHVMAYSRTQYPEFKDDYTDIDTLLAQSDFISLHCPLFSETKEIINEASISKMKDGAILINTGRGPLIDEKAVADALHSGKLRGAAVDVVSSEPISKNNPLLNAPNCIITPHMAWAPLEARQRIMKKTEDSIERFILGKSIKSVNL